MTSIIIHAENKKDISLLKELSKKMGLSAKILNIEEQEDISLAQLMKMNNENENLVKEDAMAYYQTLSKK